MNMALKYFKREADTLVKLTNTLLLLRNTTISKHSLVENADLV
jgi:hypothetical protein